MASPRSFAAFVLVSVFIVAAGQAKASNFEFPIVEIVSTPTDGGIREDIPSKYRERFDRWKAELLSTEFGRTQWQTFAENRSFVLTIRMSRGKGKGAGTDKFLWNENGDLVGATITLGPEIDDGYPNPIYYPVLNSLSTAGTSYLISGKILAATKLSHEIGHVSQTAKANMDQIERQSKLIPEYTSIFLTNGHDPSDRKLVKLAEEIGGTPIEIWESREYWSEVTAMNYLKERIRDEAYFCHVFSRIRSNVVTYAHAYIDRFEPGDQVGCSK